MPADFDAQESLLVGATMLADLYPAVLVDLVRAVHDHIHVVLMVASAAEADAVRGCLAGAGLPLSAVEFLELPIMTMWVRDFGPVTVADGAGNRCFVDFVYRERRGNAIDDDVPGHLAGRMALPIVDCPILVEGGDFLSNGLGIGLGSTRIIDRNAHHLALDPDEVVRRLAAALGFEIVQLVQPLQGEATGHLDMFCAFLRPDLAVVGRLDPQADPENAAHLDAVAATLAAMTTRTGPLQVERVDLPPAVDGTWRTYTNIVFANRTVLVPVYPAHCPEFDERALALYRRLLPDRDVVSIDASALIAMRGALRCITMNVPTGTMAGR